METSSRRVLIIDDEETIHEFFADVLASQELAIDSAHRGEVALSKIRQTEYDLIISDLMLDGHDGLELLEWARERQPEVPFVVMTGFGSVETAVEAMKRGAFDYIEKPFRPDHILVIVQKALRHSDLCREIRRLRSQVEDRAGFSGIIGKSKPMQDVFDLIRRVSDSASSILIEGESGTGKELVARAIQLYSSRRDAPFVALNCAVIPESLIESELFGHVKGAFTGAIEEKQGLFEVANGGTIFLDEIGDLHPNMQTKLLRVLQERELKPVGGTKNISVDVRVISATNVNLKKAVEEKRFRSDLYYRIAVIPIYLPPLRERQEDIPLLVDHFLTKYCRKNEISGKSITPGSLALLLDYSWPGNVRELENIIERTIMIAPEDQITPKVLPVEVRGEDWREGGLSSLADLGPDEPLGVGRLALKDLIRVASDRIERQAIVEALRLADGNRTKAAEVLEISRGSLYNKMRKLGIDEDVSDQRSLRRLLGGSYERPSGPGGSGAKPSRGAV